MVIRNMCLSVYTKYASVRIYHGNGIIVHIYIPLIKAYRQHNRKLLCHLLKMQDGIILHKRLGKLI